MNKDRLALVCAAIQNPALFTKTQLESPRLLAIKAHQIAEALLKAEGDPATKTPVAGEYVKEGI